MKKGKDTNRANGRMVRLPRERAVYPELQTSFLNFDELLAELATRHLDGYVQVRFPDFMGMLYLANGERCGAAAARRDGDAWAGRAAAEAMRERAHTRGGTVAVFEADPDLMRLVGALEAARPLHEGLSTAWVDSAKLLEALKSESVSGYARFSFVDGAGGGFVYLAGGAVLECVLAVGNKTQSGEAAVDALTHEAATRGARIDVYQAEPPVDARGRAAAPVALVSEDEAKALASAWGAILGTVERVVDRASEPGRFVACLAEALSERADEAPYLDPLAGAFTYANGELSFKSPPPREFSAALGDCLSDAISLLSFRLRQVDLETQIMRELEQVSEAYGDTLEQFGTGRAASAFLAA